MKEIRFKLDEKQFNNVQENANKLGFKNAHQYTKYLVCIANYNDDNKVSFSFEDKGNIVREKMTIYLESEQIKIIDQNAELHGWSRSKEAVFRIRSTLTDSPNLYLNEIKSLDLARTAVNRVGRNINFIIKNNRSIINDSHFYADITELLSEINNINKSVLSIVEQSKNRFLK